MSLQKPIVYIISAPSGSGKSTLVNEVLKLVPNLDFSISYTTRDPRGSEQNGKEYYFIKREEFEQMIQADEFLEHATVFGKSYYGTARRFLREAEQKGHDLLLDIDVQGAAQIKQKCPDAVSIFVLPPNRETLDWRLHRRSEDDEATISRRLAAASREIENYDKYDYIIINEDLRDSIESLTAIVRFARIRNTLLAEDRRVMDLADQCRLTRVGKRLRPILDSFRNPPPPAGH
jgi:guanylate kinase